jgi:glycosyltransferase involved in cell wall biosynthesis
MVASEGPPTRSGIARTIGRLEQGLTARGHTIDVVAFPDVPRVVIGEVRLSGLAFRLPSLLRRFGEYDIVHVHGIAPTVSDIFLAATKRVPCPPLVYTHHCDIEVGRPLNVLYNALHRRLSAHADEMVTTTNAYATHLGAEERTTVIPLGVDHGHLMAERPKDSQFTVLFVGQFRPYKGVPVLLRAMARVSGARLLIAGRGPEEQHYRSLAATLGVDAEFHINPGDSKLRELNQRAHVVVLPSVTQAEAFGIVLVEGMAAGCIPVASDLPGVREVTGRIGFTFPVGSVSELARTLRQLRDSPRQLAQISQRARERAARFTWDRTVTQYERLYSDLVDARSLRHRLLGSDAGWPESEQAVLREFARQMASNAPGDRAEILLAGDGDTLRSIASGIGDSPSHMPDRLVAEAAYRDVAPGIVALAQYSYDTRESVLLPPRPLAYHQQKQRASLIVAPLSTEKQPFGALAIVREHSFEESDLDSLTRLARYASPILDSWRRKRSSAALITDAGEHLPDWQAAKVA